MAGLEQAPQAGRALGRARYGREGVALVAQFILVPYLPYLRTYGIDRQRIGAVVTVGAYVR